MNNPRSTFTAALLGSTALLLAAPPALAQTPAPQTAPGAAAGSMAPRTGLTAVGLRNQPVFDGAGQEIGRVASVVIGTDNQAYAIVAGGALGDRQILMPANRIAFQNDRFVAGGYSAEQLRALPAYTQGASGYRNADDSYALNVAGYTGMPQGGQPGQAGADPARIVVQQSAPAIQVQQASPQVTVQQPQPQVTVRQPQPEILVRQPQPTVTVDIPQPEIIVRMPRPDVNVAMAQPQVEVRQPEPRVEVVQPAQPQVQVAPAQAQVQVQQAQGQPNVQIQGAEGQAQVRYERAEPRVVVNQAQGQPNVRFEGQEAQASPGAAATAQAEPRAPVVAAPPATTGAVPGSSATSNVRQLSVTQLEDMNVYNARGNQLGEVDDVLIGPNNAVHLVVGYGGFLGLGERKVLLPLDRFQMQNDRLVVQGMSEDQLRALPAHSRMGEGFRSAENAFQAPIGLAR